MTENTNIHPTAIIEPGAKIGENCQIGPYAYIGAHVSMGSNNNIGPHVCLQGTTQLGDNNTLHHHCAIDGDTRMGNHNEVYAFTVLGSIPQVIQSTEGTSELHIGDYNVFREYVTIQPGLEKFGGTTTIGSHNLFMISCHAGHDCHIGDYNRLTNGASLAGHVEMGNHVIVSGLSGIVQRVRLGDYAFIAAASIIESDIPPFCVAAGNRAVLSKVNTVGLSRAGLTDDDVRTIKRVFRELFFASGVFSEKLAAVTEKYGDNQYIQQLLEFINSSEIGVAPYGGRRNKS